MQRKPTRIMRNPTTFAQDYPAALVQLSQQVAWVKVPPHGRKKPMPILAINGVCIDQQLEDYRNA